MNGLTQVQDIKGTRGERDGWEVEETNFFWLANPGLYDIA